VTPSWAVPSSVRHTCTHEVHGEVQISACAFTLPEAGRLQDSVSSCAFSCMHRGVT
jgi:hypothetical protein